MLTCVKFNLMFNIPSWLRGKHKHNDKEDEVEDYAYFRWEYKESDDDQVRNYSFTKNTKQAEFENIHTWLEKLNSDTNCSLYEEDLHYACVDITNIKTTEFVETSNNYRSSNKQQFYFYTFEDDKEAPDSFDNDEESSYCSEIRRKSNALFIRH